MYKQELEQKNKETSELIIASKEKYFQEQGNKLLDPTIGPKKYWSILNTFLQKNKITIIPPLWENGNFVNDYSIKANIFNDYFVSQSTLLEGPSTLPPFQLRTTHSLSALLISENFILENIRALNPNKASGWDEISPIMLKICDSSIIKPIAIIFKTCMATGIYPSNWKMSNVCPVHKKNSKYNEKNYTPISLLPILSKIFEKTIFDALYNYFTKNELLVRCQSGFIKGDLCVSQLLSIIHSIPENLDSDPSLDTKAIFLDLSKAFDKVWHAGLIYKLRSYGITGNVLNLLRNYLDGRKQRVVVNGTWSSWKYVNAGAPQGWVLGPLLFLISINDLPDDLICNPKLFADDVSLNAIMYDKEQSTSTIQSDLEKLLKWSVTWKMEFNPDENKPAKEILFTNRNSNNYDPIICKDIAIKAVDEHKYLGLILDNKLTFSKHIDEKISLANRGIAVIRRLYHYLPRKSLIQIYKSFIGLHLDYCDVIYHKPSFDEFSNEYYSERALSDPAHINENYNDKIEAVQHTSALAITGCIHGTSRDKLYAELGLESLYDRKLFHRLVYFYKIVNNLDPNYLKKHIPSPTLNVYNTRRHREEWIHSRTLRYKYSFFPHTLNCWNQLSNYIKTAPSLSVFKKRLMDFFAVANKSLYGIHNPQGIKLLTRLRVGLSHLRAHKYTHNFKDTTNPICPCGLNESETLEHYMLFCLSYSDPRKQLFNSLCKTISLVTFVNTQYICDLLLYGDPKSNSCTNKEIIEATMEYILSSKRFDTQLIEN